MFVYAPHSVILPASAKTERVLPKISHDYRHDVEVDVKTVFYDVFVNPHTNRLHAIGPKLFNLKRDIFPLSILVNGKPVDYRLHEVRKLVFLESEELPNSLLDSISVALRFKTFAQTIDIDLGQSHRRFSDADTPPPAPPNAAERGCASRTEHARKQALQERLTISTLQKNNHLDWIKDWVLWHRRLYGVRRVVLYDNGSDDQESCIEMLRSLEPEVETVFVRWAFPYGYGPYEFAQRASLNHCRMMAGALQSHNEITGQRRPGYCINLDVDECLVSPLGFGLADYLDSKLDLFRCGVHIKEMRVPAIKPGAQFSDVPRLFDFRHRFRKFGDKPDGLSEISIDRDKVSHEFRKYIYRLDGGLYNDVHYIERVRHEFSGVASLRYFFYRLGKKFMRLIWTIKRILRVKGIEYPKVQYDMLRAPQSEMYFFHFMGVGANWKKLDAKEMAVYMSEHHVEEPLIVELAHRAKLPDSEHQHEND